MNIKRGIITCLLLLSLILAAGCFNILEEERQEVPNAAIESQYHPSNGTLTITHGGGTHFVSENTNRVFVVRERDGEREELREIGLPFETGDSVTVPAQPGDTVIVRANPRERPLYNVNTIAVATNRTG